MAAPRPIVRKFNPGIFQSDEDVIAQFVVRHREFGILMNILRSNAGASTCQHTLIVAPRGRGKTMMLARIAAELRTSDALRPCLLPVRFTEESYEVFNAGEFWLDALCQLAPEVARHDPEMAAELREAHAEFRRRWRDRDLEELARTVVLEAAQRLGSKLVLMVENCQVLFDNVDERFGWSLRKTLQTEPNVIFVGTATTRMAALDDVQGPFYEFFRPLLLAPLPLDECKALWEAASGEVRSEREIRPMQILTGGDPRLLVIIAGFARHRSLKELLEELVSLIDDHTEYFRSHLDRLGKMERRVYLALVDLWRPSTTAEIAARSMQEIRTVSSLLGRLVKRGAVAYEGEGQKRLYSATQRLYSIYYKLRRQRDEAALVHSLIQWLVACFTSDELSAVGEQLAKDAIQSTSIREGFRLALRDIPAIRGKFPQLVRFVGEAEEAEEALEFTVRASHYADANQPAKVLALRNEVLQRCGSNEERARVALHTLKGLAEGRLGNWDEAIDAYDAIASLGGNNAPASRVLACMALACKAATQLTADRAADALETCSQINERYGGDGLEAVRVWVARALVSSGLAWAQAGENDEAFAAWDQVVARYGNDGPRFHHPIASALAAKSVHLVRIGDAASALATFADLAVRYRDSDDSSVRRIMAIAFVNRAELQARTNRPDDALATIHDLVERFSKLLNPFNLQWIEWTRARALLARGDRELALAMLQSTYDKLTFDGNTPGLLLHHVPELIGGGLMETDLLRILTSDPQKSAMMDPIVATLRRRIGESVRIPAEVLEVARDLAVHLDEAIAAVKGR